MKLPVVIAGILSATLGLAGSLFAAEPRSNIVLILADDKYHSAAASGQTCREIASFLRQMPQFQMSAGSGQFGAIPGN